MTDAMSDAMEATRQALVHGDHQRELAVLARALQRHRDSRGGLKGRARDEALQRTRELLGVELTRRPWHVIHGGRVRQPRTSGARQATATGA
jgi:hypothetical protein